jgi:hypothetical protein
MKISWSFFSGSNPASVKATVSRLVKDGVIVKTTPIEKVGRGRKSYNMKFAGDTSVEPVEPVEGDIPVDVFDIPVDIDYGDNDIIPVHRMSPAEEKEIIKSILEFEMK